MQNHRDSIHDGVSTIVRTVLPDAKTISIQYPTILGRKRNQNLLWKLGTINEINVFTFG